MAVLKNTIMKDCPAINEIAPTFQTDDHGKWIVCTTQAKLKEAQEWMDTHIRTLLDPLATQDKPPVPTACPPQRVVNYAEVPDAQVTNLHALSVSTIAGIPKINAWGHPPLTATTQPATSPSTLSASHVTLFSELANKLESLQIQFDAREMAIDHKNRNFPTPLPEPILNETLKQVRTQNDIFKSSMEEVVESLKADVQSTVNTVTKMRHAVASNAQTVVSLNDRFDDFQSRMDIRLGPLEEATKAGGLAALINACLSQHINPVSTQPMDEDFPHTPRRLVDPALSTALTSADSSGSDTTSGRKREEPPSPFSRKGQASPSRARLDGPITNSSRYSDDG